MVQDLPIPLLHLSKRVGVVEGRDGDVAAVDDLEPAGGERVDDPDGVEAAALLLAAGGGADSSRAETCAGSIGGRGVVGEAYYGDVQG